MRPASRNLQAVLLLFGLCLAPLALAKPYLVVPQSSENAVDIVDTATNTLTATLPLGADPEDVVMAPNGNEAYVGAVTSTTSGSTTTLTSAIYTLDLASSSISAETTLQSGTSNIAIGAMAISPDGSLLYVMNPLSGVLMSVDLATGAVGTVTRYGSGQAPAAMLVGTTGRHLFVTLTNASELSIVTLATGNVSTLTIPDGFDPLALALSPDGSRLYIANSGNNTIAVLDTETGSFLNSITVTGFPDSLSVSPNGSTLAVALPASGLVDLIPVGQSSPVTPINVGSAPSTLAYAPDGTRLYVLDSAVPELSVVDTANASVVTTLQLANAATIAGAFVGAGDIIAQGATFDLDENTVLDGTLTATDDLDRTLSYALAEDPVHGQMNLTASDGAFSYTPASGFTGADHLAFTAAAASGPGAPTLPVSAPAPVRICVLPSQVSLAPIPATAIAESTSSAPTEGIVSFTPSVNCGLTFSAVSSNPSLIPDSSIAFGGVGTNQFLTLSPAAGASGNTDITVTAKTQNNASASQTFSVFVGMPPVISGLSGPFYILVSNSFGPMNFTVTGTTPITFTTSSDEPAILPTSGIILGGSGENRTLTLRPIPNRLGTAVATVTATDAHGLQSTVSFDVEVVPNTNSSAVDPTTLLFLLALLLIGGRRRLRSA